MGSKKIVAALDPSGNNVLTCKGKSLYGHKQGNATLRISHIRQNASKTPMLQRYPQLPREKIMGNAYGATEISEQYKLWQGTKVEGIYCVLSFPQGLGVIKNPLPPIRIALYVGNAPQPRQRHTISLEGLANNVDKSIDWSAPALHEVYLPLTEAIEIPSAETLYIGIDTGQMPEGVSLFHQLGDNNFSSENFIHYKVQGNWAPASNYDIQGSLWLDPVVTLKDKGMQTPQEEQLVSIMPENDEYIYLKVAKRAWNKPVLMEVFTLKGREVVPRDAIGELYFISKISIRGKRNCDTTLYPRK